MSSYLIVGNTLIRAIDFPKDNIIFFYKVRK